ncbi:PRELI-like family-domain-containing protein [Cercophora samala]|uniref:PRELI-like family-domain-containing protein n=1 Tax=Cercophora samala TaxID=330535 RepID=A0AA39ZIP4_9PEZI|nr:PRELI-like family-domain-containing protein [Cercophora samala]
MKVFSNTETFNYSWEEVSTANWRKYCPWNDKSTHVLAVDTISRTVDPETGILRTERLITCKQSMPEILKKIMGAGMEEQQVFETSYVDPKKRTVTMVSENITWNNLLNVQETVVYKPLNDHQTAFEQAAKITALCGGWQKIKNSMEDALVKRFRDNAARGKEGFEAVLAMSRRVFAEEQQREKMMLIQAQAVNIRMAA